MNLLQRARDDAALVDDRRAIYCSSSSGRVSNEELWGSLLLRLSPLLGLKADDFRGFVLLGFVSGILSYDSRGGGYDIPSDDACKRESLPNLARDSVADYN